MNFGDEITPLLIERLFGLRCVWYPPDTCDLAGAGSILEILDRESGNNEIKVWGSGFIKDGAPLKSKNLVFHAARGKMTQDRIAGDSIGLGDPGILMSRAFPMVKKPKFRIGIIPHYIDADHEKILSLRGNANILIIDALGHPLNVAKQINSCELILSSSLHGLIFSDSYGVPNCRIKLSDKLTGGDYKFNDYYSVFNKKSVLFDMTKIKDRGYVQLHIKNYTKPANLSHAQDELVYHFPY